jgi:peptidyl-prolyl cis-trans isomerase D
MLKVFRDNLKYLSWVLWLVIAVFILFVFVDFGGSVPGGTTANTAAVKVDGREVSYGEFERAYRQTEDTYRRLYGEQFSTETARQLGLPMQVLNGLIADRLLLDEAERMGLEVSDEELQREILAFPAFQREDGSFVGGEEYQRILRQSGMSSSGFEDLMRTELLTEKVRAVLAENIFVPEGEVERTYRRQVEQARIRFVRLPWSEIDADIEIDEEELAAFFDDHRDDYRIPERRAVEYLLVDRREIQTSLTVDDAEVRAYYDDNTNEFNREEQVRARHILLSVGPDRTAAEARAELEDARQKLADGADFAELARQLSDDPGSRDRGGDLGLFGRGDMVAPFEAAAFGAEPGEIVGPVETDFGVHLIEVVDKQPGGSISFADAEQGIRSRLLAQRAQVAAEEKAAEISSRLRGSSDEAADLESIAAEEGGVTYHSTDPFGRDDNVPGIGRASQFSVAAFELASGEISDPVPTAGGWAVLELLEIEEPRLPELEEVREAVENDLRESKLGRLAVDRLAAAALALADGSTLEEQAEGLGLEVQESELFGADDPVAGIGRVPALANAALDLEEGAFGGPVEIDDGAVLFEVVERRHFDPATFTEEKENTRQTLEAEQLNDLLTVMLDARREEADIVFDPQLLATFAADEQPAAGS